MSNICQAGGALFSKKTPFLQHFGQMSKKRRLAQSWKCWLNCLRTSKKLTFTQAERNCKNHLFSSKVKCPISVKRVEYILTTKPFLLLWKKNATIVDRWKQQQPSIVNWKSWIVDHETSKTATIVDRYWSEHFPYIEDRRSLHLSTIADRRLFWPAL